MQQSITTVIILISTILPGKSINPDKGNFTFIKEANGITISSRWITTASNRETREMKAEFNVAANPEVVLSLIKNDGLAMKWMKSLSEFSVLKHESENTWVAYIQYNIPWPLNNQDCIIRYNCIKNTDGKHFEITLTGVPSYLPSKDGVDRITHMSGRWKVTSGPDSTCKVEYTVYSEQKPVFPRWVTDPIVQNNLIDTMTSMRELSEKLGNQKSATSVNKGYTR